MFVTKEFSFDAAHQLVGHCGKCANLHGHTYKVAVTVAGELNQRPGASGEGMVVDFADLKAFVQPTVEAMDHSFIAQGNEPVLQVLRATGSKIYDLAVRSTVENIAAHIFDKIDAQIQGQAIAHGARVTLHSVKLWETPTSYVVASRSRDEAADD